MDVLFLAFSNSRTAPLSTLQKEDDNLYRILSPGALNQQFLLHRDSYATTDSIAHYLAQYRDHVRLFLYSGHAGRDQLLLEDEAANVQGVSHLLGQCPKLELVFLNGCSTKGQVQALLEKGIPAVMATSAPIDDEKAANFSTRFFQSLQDRSTVQEAFELAKGEILTRNPEIDVNIHSSLPVWGAEQKQESLWGLYLKDTTSPSIQWKLPTETKSREQETYIPNKKLLDTLLLGLAPHAPDIQKIVDDEDMGAEKSILDKREAILKALPHPVSEQLRKLLVDPGPEAANVVFFNKAGLPRLEQMARIFSTQIELLAYVMMAQLWDLFSFREDITITANQQEILKHFLFANQTDKESIDLGNLIQTIRKILDEHDEPYFIPELKGAVEDIKSKEEVSDAVLYMNHLKDKLDDRSVGNEEAVELCITAEEKLATFMKSLGWLANYTLVSIKAIDVLKYRHLKEPKYKARMVKLVQRFVGLAEDQEISDSLMDCDSVLIIKEGSADQKYLNLTPFVIDENAFDDKASIAKLYFFDRYDKSSESFLFKHVYKPTDVPLIVKDQKHFRMLKVQFNAFSKVLFNQEMAAL